MPNSDKRKARKIMSEKTLGQVAYEAWQAASSHCFSPSIGWETMPEPYRTWYQEMGQAVIDTMQAEIEQLRALADYAKSVRMDRWTIEDDCVLCLQTEEWCRGLLAAADAARGGE